MKHAKADQQRFIPCTELTDVDFDLIRFQNGPETQALNGGFGSPPKPQQFPMPRGAIRPGRC
ncbi:MAG TPA: hypothetical protein VGL78_10975 [Solirubrobacteraceae bacterium]